MRRNEQSKMAEQAILDILRKDNGITEGSHEAQLASKRQVSRGENPVPVVEEIDVFGDEDCFDTEPFVQV